MFFARLLTFFSVPNYTTILIVIAILMMANVAIADPVSTNAPDNKNETFITARHMTSDQNTGILTATGKVEIARGGYILHADKVTYNQKTSVMHAEGHCAMLTPSGDVQFADHEDVTGDMKQGFLENMAILFPDNSRMSARIGQRFDGRWLVADRGIYTACNVCKENPDQPPIWQLRANEIVHDNVEHDIYYHDATIDFAGLPVLYTPYLSMPDPTVDRRQGFLTAMPGYSPDLGAFIRVPYYWDIAPNADAVIAPEFSTKDKIQLGGEYRERFENGNMQFIGSFTRADLVSDTGTDEGESWRGHLFGNTLFNLDNVWRAGTDVAFTSDKSYLERYRYSSTDELVNRAYVEGFQGRSYSVIDGYYFQNLRPGDQPVEPLVLPEANFHALGEPGQTFGGRWSLDGGLLVTTRDNLDESLIQQGPNTRRLSLNGGWERRFISDTGLTTTVSGLVRGDSYWADNVVRPDGTGVYNNVILNRQFEQANIVSSYPMGRHGDGYEQMLEPIIAFTGAPTVKISPKQPNEDSLDVEFDETNLFSPNRYPGTDLIEGGSRATYGLRHTVTADNGMHVDMFGGQSYNINKDNEFPELSGLNTKFSDYVGRIDLVPSQWFNLNYGARLDQGTLSPQRQDASLTFGAPIFRPGFRYISAYETETTGIVDQVRELVFNISSNFTKYWTFNGSQTQAFSPDPGPRSTTLGVTYNDECFIFGVAVSRNDTTRADISAGTSVVFHFYLKNLGGVHTDSTTNATFPEKFRQY